MMGRWRKPYTPEVYGSMPEFSVSKALARAFEKAGFVEDFKMAVNIMYECQ